MAQWPIILQEWYEGDEYPDGYWESDPPGSPRGPGCSSTVPVLHCLVWPLGREFICQILDCRIRMQPFPRSRSAQLQARCWGNDGMDSRQVPHTRQERNLLNWSSYKGKQVSPTDVSTSFVTGIYRAPHMCLNCISAVDMEEQLSRFIKIPQVQTSVKPSKLSRLVQLEPLILHLFTRLISKFNPGLLEVFLFRHAHCAPLQCTTCRFGQPAIWKGIQLPGRSRLDDLFFHS